MPQEVDSAHKRFVGEIDWVAQQKARGIDPQTLISQGEHEEAQNLGRMMKSLEENNLMAEVDRRVEEIKRLEEMVRLNSLPRPRRTTKKGPKPIKMYLEQAHPQGYAGMWRLPPLEPKSPDETLDPERKINSMHYRKRLSAIHEKDLAHQWREKLKEWGYTDANKRKKLEMSMEDAILRLKEAGLWYLIRKPGLSREEIDLIRAAFSGPDPYDEV